MRPVRRLLCIALVSSVAAVASAAEPAMVFIAPTNHVMPLEQFQNGVLRGGLLKELGELIAQRLGRPAAFVSIPSRRVSEALASGAADGLCYALPRWLEGSYNWSRPLIPNGGLVVARADAPVIHALSELADQPVGTIGGYHYPEIEAALGQHFLRDDAPTMEHNLRKLDVGRMQYAVVEQATLNYLLRIEPQLRLRGDLLFASFTAQCAFSRKSKIPFEQVEHVVNTLIDDGSMQALLAKYR